MNLDKTTTVSRYHDAFELIREINMEEIKTITLVKLIRGRYKMSLGDSLYCARLMLEAYRIGKIRGQTVNNCK